MKYGVLLTVVVELLPQILLHYTLQKYPPPPPLQFVFS